MFVSELERYILSERLLRTLSLSLCNRLAHVLKAEKNAKALYLLCELHRKGGNRVIAKNYCNQSLQVDPNAPGPLHALGLFSFGKFNQ